MKNKKVKKEEEDITSLLKQVGEKAGLSVEEMVRRYNEFLSQTATSSISDEELDRRVKDFLETISKGKRKEARVALKVTVTLSEDEAKKFFVIKEAIGAKSNAAVLREVLHSYRVD